MLVKKHEGQISDILDPKMVPFGVKILLLIFYINFVYYL